MKKIFYNTLILAAATVAFSACQTNKQSNETTENPLTEETHSKTTTKDFVNEVASDGMMEIAMANMALEKSENPEVKGLATTIKNDHQKANRKLETLAHSNNWEFPKQMLKEHQNKVDELKKEGGSAEEFDLLYLYALEDDHKASIKKLEGFSGEEQYVEGTENLNNDTLKNFSENQSATTKGKNFDSNNTLKSDSTGYVKMEPKKQGGVVTNTDSDTTGNDLKYSSNTEGNTDGRETEPTKTNTNAGAIENNTTVFKENDKKATNNGGIKDTNTLELNTSNSLTLQGWINETLPVIKSHLKQTKKLHEELRN